MSHTFHHYSAHQFDRLGLTLFVALVFHAIIILGVSFQFEDHFNGDALSTMEITLVQSKAKEAPEEADYLAQADQLGGGNVQDKVRPSSPFSNPHPTPEEGIAPDSREAMSPPPLKEQKAQKELMTAPDSHKQVPSKPQETPVPEQTKSVTAAQLFERSREVARLRAEIDDLKKAFEKTPRQTYVTGLNAKQYRFASYIEAWRDKVERIGSINYPEEALKRNVNGTLLLDVGINPDGSIHGIKLLRPSGHKVLDEAAKRIVHMAAPFPPLSKAIREDTDILHISLVWNFQVKRGLSTSVK
jgi:protein TonB